MLPLLVLTLTLVLLVVVDICTVSPVVMLVTRWVVDVEKGRLQWGRRGRKSTLSPGVVQTEPSLFPATLVGNESMDGDDTSASVNA